MVIALCAAAVAAFIVLASRRKPVRADHVNDAHEVTVRAAAPTTVGTVA
ncbi:hypothetical protein ACFY1B_00755 [Streptomyces mirabilis]